MAAPLDRPVEVAPLASMRLTGGFGELRSNHFHAGLDLSTGGRVGAPVRAPLACTVERVRASGVGYGRSLYVRAADGRLFVFGHLDAFAPALAAYVDSVQRAVAQYEQDLWPPAGRFRFASGETLAWSGESGAGAPHLHVEVRHGDFALSPLRAGLSMPRDDGAPVIESVVLETISLGARVERRASPFTWRPGMSDTIVVRGAARAIVRARSGLAGAGDVPAWSTAIEWSGWTIEARLDSISWAGEMAQLDWLVDRGRVNGAAANGGMILWAAPGARPRFLRTNVPEGVTGGTLVVSPGEAARPLLVRARDVNGRESTRTLWLRAPRTADELADAVDERKPRPKSSDEDEPEDRGYPWWDVASLPGGDLLRVRLKWVGGDEFAGLRDARIAHVGWPDSTGERATWDGQAWSAIVPAGTLPNDDSFWMLGTRPDSSTCSSGFSCMTWRAGEDRLILPNDDSKFSIPPGGVFEPSSIVTSYMPNRATDRRWTLNYLRVEPRRLPLAKPIGIALRLRAHHPREGVGLYRRDSDGDWEFQRASFDTAGRWYQAETSTLGEFALLRDVAPPVVRTAKPPRRASAGAYSRWQLVAQVSDALSGIDARLTRFVVDGQPVPSEWDPEERQLRWRPLLPPAKGRHSYEVVATDRAGLVTRTRGTFVLDSAREVNPSR
ncbi:MAG: M23 family metallopeptidase [Candidatus Eisenbacteria bacterium]|uniref:M23 family metallopeptidase n=1 Tax=Eiseniibacteriota bacterium TaxID=2212470 RepID=A0A933W944_UNCEI|nr:M23 family metallopeptidase [Candidatus Eisenbacteria bacterium]